MKSRTKSAKIIKMTPPAENAIDDEDALDKAIAASFAALERVGRMDITKAQRAAIQRKIIADVVFGVF
jgi:hypothetical protein